MGTALIIPEWNKHTAHWWNDNDREETIVLGHSAILSTTNPTRTPQGLIPCLCGEKSVTDCLLYYTVSNVIQDSRADDYTGCHRRKGPNFGRVFLMLNYTNITQNTYIQS